MSVRNRIIRIGLELEGGWPQGRGPATVRHDGSVRNINPELRVGEVSSDPLPTLAGAELWLRENYPQEANDTCGFHVHVSTNKLNYSRMMERDFFDMFFQRMNMFVVENATHPGFDLLAQRLHGDNRYCQRKHRPEAQLFLQDAYGDPTIHPRYSALNFCFARHGTLECRIFPCFPNVDDSIAGLRVFCEIVNTYLSQCSAEKPVTVLVSEKDIPPELTPKSTTKKHVLDYSVARS